MSISSTMGQWRHRHQSAALYEYSHLCPGVLLSFLATHYQDCYSEINLLVPRMFFGNHPELSQRAIYAVANFCDLFPTHTPEQRRSLWGRLKTLIYTKQHEWKIPEFFVNYTYGGNPDEVRWFLYNLVYYEMTAMFRCLV